MRVVVAGGTGVIGRELVPLLVAAGHEVTGLTKSTGSAANLRSMGAAAAVADLLDRSAVQRVVQDVVPGAVVHMATAIPREINPRRMASDFDLTSRLRAEGTRNLLDAAAEAGVRKVVTQGVAFAYDPQGAGPATEAEPLWREPPAQFAPVLAALLEMERRTAEAGGTVLRFGHLYGPGTAFGPDGSFVRHIRAGKLPLVGGGTAVFSFTHTHDAATAVLAALDKELPGAVNVVDDEPARVNMWLPYLAELLEARRPRPAPTFVARMVVGGWGVAFLTRLRGASNARAKLELDWRPRYPSWRPGFADLLTNGPSAGSSTRDH